MTMKLPHKVKIGGHWFKISFLSEKDGGFDTSGRKMGWQGKIFIQERMTESKKQSVLLHEIIHEISWQNNLDLTESQVSALSEGFYQVITDNPGMWK